MCFLVGTWFQFPYVATPFSPNSKRVCHHDGALLELFVATCHDGMDFEDCCFEGGIMVGSLKCSLSSLIMLHDIDLSMVPYGTNGLCMDVHRFIYAVILGLN